MKMKLSSSVHPKFKQKHSEGLHDFLCHLRPQKVNYMFLRHFVLENDAGGRLFIFYFFYKYAIKRCIRVISGKIFDF